MRIYRVFYNGVELPDTMSEFMIVLKFDYLDIRQIQDLMTESTVTDVDGDIITILETS